IRAAEINRRWSPLRGGVIGFPAGIIDDGQNAGGKRRGNGLVHLLGQPVRVRKRRSRSCTQRGRARLRGSVVVDGRSPVARICFGGRVRQQVDADRRSVPQIGS